MKDSDGILLNPQKVKDSANDPSFSRGELNDLLFSGRNSKAAEEVIKEEQKEEEHVDTKLKDTFSEKRTPKR